MKFFVLMFAFLFQSAVLAAPQIAILTSPDKITVGMLTLESKEVFESKYPSFFKNQWNKCNACQVRNLTVYGPDGKPDLKAMAAQIESAVGQVSFFFLNFNLKFNKDDYKDLAQVLRKVSQNGILIVGSSGVPPEGENSAPLSKTLLGQVQDALIIGEMNDRERLTATGFFGPEMLTAVRTPRDFVGQSLAPSLFVAKLAEAYNRKKPQDWIAHLRSQKSKSRKIWPQLEDFFRNY